jgi:hypothetical protein
MGNIFSMFYYSCKKNKNKKNTRQVSPSRVFPPSQKIQQKKKLQQKIIKKHISDELDDVLYKYRKTHPLTLIVDSPRYGLDKREVLKNFGLSNHYIKS